MIASIATNEGVKNVQIVFTLNSSLPNQYAPALEDWWAAEAADKNPRLVAVWNCPTDHRNPNFDGSIYIKRGIFAPIDNSWPGYDYLYKPMLHHTLELKRSKDALEASSVKEDNTDVIPADRFKDATYALRPGKYSNVEMRPYPTDEPVIEINAKAKVVFPVEITKGDGTKYISAIMDNSVFDKTPLKTKINEPLSTITTPKMLRLLGMTTETMLVDIEVADKYDTSIITDLSYHEPFM